MPDESAYEPYVFLERGETARPSRMEAPPQGCRPGILLVDGEEDPEGVLSRLLFEGGFDVYRTARGDSARELVQGRSSILMALVRLDRTAHESGALVRELLSARPGLWVGMLVSGESRAATEEGYRAGADDLFRSSAPFEATVGRLARSVPRALGKRARVERELGRRRRFRVPGLLRRGLTYAVVASLGLGAALAAVTQAWQEADLRWNARLERLVAALEKPEENRMFADRPFDRWSRTGALELERHMHEEQMLFQRAELEETRLRHLLRNIRPEYPRP